MVLIASPSFPEDLVEPLPISHAAIRHDHPQAILECPDGIAMKL
jgi:hypothetical protein